MKKLLVGIILGMLLHKTLNFAYDYSWNYNYEVTCKDKEFQKDKFDCVYKNLGAVKILQYVLARPASPYSFDKEGWVFP